MGIRNRKHTLIALLKAQAEAVHFPPEMTLPFEQMIRQARTEADQDEVMTAFKKRLFGWHENKDAFAIVRRGFLDDVDDEDEDPPALKAALERSQVSFRKP